MRASLQLAVALIALYAAALVGATVVESTHGATAARLRVYDTWWFAALNALLAVDVFWAMLVRFPWRWRQAGFVVTHAGILVLLAGCLASWHYGIDAQLPIFEGRAEHLAREDSRTIDLGFQVYLHKFRRKLDPGGGMASHYSSLVDFLARDSSDRGDPPKKLRENVLITLNAPVDFTDPRSGRTYRLFQSSFEGPWLPGDPEFDKLTGGGRDRDQVYLSLLSVNYDPGRGLKYAGSLLVVVGIGVGYYLRLAGRLARRVRAYLTRGGQTRRLNGVVWIIILFSAAGNVCAGDAEKLDWSTWQRLPVFGEGRVAPLDTFARETVEAICGRAEPTLVLENERRRKFTAAELLFRWLVEPEKWETIPFLVADDEQLREEVLGLPLFDKTGRRLRWASPVEVKNNVELGRRWTELQRRADAEGKDFRLTGLDGKIKKLVDAYGKYRLLTFDLRSSKDAPRRFYARLRLVADAWRKLAGDGQAARRISSDQDVRRLMVQAGQLLQKLIVQIHGDEFSLEKIEPLAAAFHQVGNELATRLTNADDKLLTALAADLRRQTAEMHLALYDNGEVLRLVPALGTGALEAHRTPDDDASPWLSFQAMIAGSDDLLRAYPRSKLLAVRKAFDELKANAPPLQWRGVRRRQESRENRIRFAAAMDRFAKTLRALGEKVEPLREKLPIQHRDQELIDQTAYPPPSSTDAEVLYNRLDPFFWSWTVSLAATLCLLLAVGRWRKPLFWLGVMTLIFAQTFTAVGLGLRAYVTGLVPLTGMFETVVFVALYAALLGLWFALLPLWTRDEERGARDEGWAIHCPLKRMDRVLRRRPFALSGAIVSFLAAALAYYAPATVMHRNIGAVAPILRDNFWLAVHVLTIMASYASAAIALILGNIALGYYLFGRYDPSRGSRRPPEACSVLAGFTYTAIRITVLLLAAGTALGALWADKAWGRFWGWDPKEVWALISLLTYLLILHAQYVGWSGDFGMSVAAVLGFTAVLFTWYGVNFLLGSGMHSYGSGTGGQWAVGAAVALEWLFLAAATVRYRAL